MNSIREKWNRICGLQPSATRVGAFTLIELMTVIVIICLLASILLPSILNIRAVILRSQAVARLRTIGSAVAEYYNDCNVYPDSTPVAYANPDPNVAGYPNLPSSDFTYYPQISGVNPLYMEGRNRLVEALVGYLGQSWDGQDGNGWRIGKGTVHGPYAGAEKLPVTIDSDTATAFKPDLIYTTNSTKSTMLAAVHGYVFTDPYSNKILYYRYSSSDNAYKSGDNRTWSFGSSGAPQVGKKIKDTTTYSQSSSSILDVTATTTFNPSPATYRSDYILLSPGRNGSYEGLTSGNTTTDDITNFLPE